MSLNLSVIIPVYNAEAFVERAVKSALEQPQTREVVLVEDASPDDSYRVCRRLDDEHDAVRLVTHPGHVNRGAGPSRNLGIRRATEDVIAFLDADDFYLPGRFDHVGAIFDDHPDADGVYDAIGVHFDTEAARAHWEETRGITLTTMRERVPPEELFLAQDPIGSKGYAHLNGWTVRRRAFDAAGMFNPTVGFHEDTDLIIRLAIACRMYPGKLDEPVAMRGVHDDNRITAYRSPKEAFTLFVTMLSATWEWALNNGYEQEAAVLEDRYVQKCNERLVYGRESLGTNRHLEAAGWFIQLMIGLRHCPPQRRGRLLRRVITDKLASLLRRLQRAL